MIARRASCKSREFPIAARAGLYTLVASLGASADAHEPGDARARYGGYARYISCMI